MALFRHEISSSWMFKKKHQPDDFYHTVAQFPTTIHLDMLAAGRIPDPLVGTNEVADAVTAVADAAWVYRTTFATPRRSRGADRAVLVFQGLDTVADVTLNGKRILESDNMFIEHRVDVSDVLRPPAAAADDDDGAGDDFLLVPRAAGAAMLNENELVITFSSAQAYGEAKVAAAPDHKWLCSNGDRARLAVRKAQYHWGWDWGPTVLTCGPWKPILLETYSARIADLHAEPLWDGADSAADFDGLGHLDVEVKCAVEGSAAAQVVFHMEAEDDSFSMMAVQSVDDASALGPQQHQRVVRVVFRVPSPKLWYPAGHGAQSMYLVRATVKSAVTTEETTGTTTTTTTTTTTASTSPSTTKVRRVLDTLTKHVAFRHVKLVQAPCTSAGGSTTNPPTTFFFQINGIPIFCGGSNWIPPDMFLPRVSPARYREWIDRFVVGGNQAMVRVWGGGTYEHDAFYDACDEAGVLVWQDFMFACGNYPASPAFRKSVHAEAVQAVRRLRHHPSVVLWAGNNEDYQIAEEHGLDYDVDDTDPANWLRSDFPARYTYERLLKEVCAALAPGVPYHPGSPWGGADSSDARHGDIHQWNVWHGPQRPYQDYPLLAGKFVSEFGMQALPVVATTESYLVGASRGKDSSPSSAVVDFHNKATGQDHRNGGYLVSNLGYATPPTLAGVTYATQLVQSEAVCEAMRGWRALWGGGGGSGGGSGSGSGSGSGHRDEADDAASRVCGGALVWQLNDVWACTSWAVVDWHMRPKPAWFAMKRELAPVAVRVVRRAATAADDGGVKAGHEVFVVTASNLGRCERSVELSLRACDATTGESVQLVNVRDGAVVSDAPATFVLPANASGFLLAQARCRLAGAVVVATLTDGRGRVGQVDASRRKSCDVARQVSFAQPLKHVAFGEPGIRLSVDTRACVLRLSAERPAKGVVVEADGVEFADNMVDVVPGERVEIAYTPVGKLDRKPFRVTYYGGCGGVMGVHSVVPETRFE